MEHRVIQGGEQYLPFARSRIRALRATGLLYASQKFDLGDATVTVQIEPGHEYIRLEGGRTMISGVARDSKQVVLDKSAPPPKQLYLSSFRPTEDTVKNVKAPANGWSKDTFAPVPWLARTTAKHVLGDSQFGSQPVSRSQPYEIAGSMYSGLMAKCVQLLLGLDRGPATSWEGTDAVGPVIQYDYHYNRTHGIYKAPSGRLWLVEISYVGGVVASPLGLIGRADRRTMAGREANKLFGGVPSGGIHPGKKTRAAALASGAAALTAGDTLTPGDALLLIPPSGLATFYRTPPSRSDHLGWVFSDSGSEARNITTWLGDPSPADGQPYANTALMSIVFSEDETGIPSASLTEIERGTVAGGITQVRESVTGIDRSVYPFVGAWAVSALGFGDSLPDEGTVIGVVDVVNIYNNETHKQTLYQRVERSVDMVAHRGPVHVVYIKGAFHTVYSVTPAAPGWNTTSINLAGAGDNYYITNMTRTTRSSTIECDLYPHGGPAWTSVLQLTGSPKTTLTDNGAYGWSYVVSGVATGGTTRSGAVVVCDSPYGARNVVLFRRLLYVGVTEAHPKMYGPFLDDSADNLDIVAPGSTTGLPTAFAMRHSVVGTSAQIVWGGGETNTVGHFGGLLSDQPELMYESDTPNMLPAYRELLTAPTGIKGFNFIGFADPPPPP